MEQAFQAAYALGTRGGGAPRRVGREEDLLYLVAVGVIELVDKVQDLIIPLRFRERGLVAFRPFQYGTP